MNSCVSVPAIGIRGLKDSTGLKEKESSLVSVPAIGIRGLKDDGLDFPETGLSFSPGDRD